MLIITNYDSLVKTSLGLASALWENGEKVGKQGEPRESGEGKGGNKSVFS